MKVIDIHCCNFACFSSLQRLSKEDLNNLPNLKYLNLAKNKLSDIETDSFGDLPNLEELDLTDNNLEDIDESSFQKLRKLRSIYLGNNGLRKLHPSTFSNLPSLQNVSLEGNKIQEIDPYIFSQNPDIENIWLNDNKIKTLEPKTFKDLRKLDFLDLRGNECVNQYFTGKELKDLKYQLISCIKDDVKTENISFRPDTKPSIPKITKPSETEEPKEIACDLNYVNWADDGSEQLYTCTVESQIVDGPNYIIKPTSHAPYVEAIRFDNNKRLKELPKKIGEVFPNLKKFSAKNTSITSLDPEVFTNLNNLKGEQLKYHY